MTAPRRLALVAVVAGALVSAGLATPASATGACDQKVEVACNETPCVPDYPCSINICVVYYSGKCLV